MDGTTRYRYGRAAAGDRAMAVMACLLAAMASGFAHAAEDWQTPSPDGARVYFIAPADGATVSSPVRVLFGLDGMGIAPAGVEHDNTGHHHLIVDAPLPSFDEPIPTDENHRHFGGGQTETAIELPPGEHTLQLLLGDRNHIPHVPAVTSLRITITVE